VDFGKYGVTSDFATKGPNMSAKYALSAIFLAGLALAAPAWADSDAGNPKLIPNDMSLCSATAKGPAVLVKVTGFKDRVGNVRMQTYSDKQEELLEKGKYFNRIIQAISATGDVLVCMPVPKPGRYVIFVQHDRNANGSLGTSDGAGFSNNPKLRFGLPKPPKPSAREIAVDAPGGVVKTEVVLNYLSGFTIKPMVQPK
jgi:uncharacterized protein (DUF2141 family)